MIKSMTGYGKASVAVGTKTITVEVRSLNSKQLDLSVKTPALYRAAEYAVRSAAAQRIGRGKADLYVSFEDASATGAARVDAALFADYSRQIGEAARGTWFDLDSNTTTHGLLAAAILRMPDVVAAVDRCEASDEETAALLRATDEALDALDAFRAEEGAVLLADVAARVDAIEGLLARVEPFEQARVGAVRARIAENVAAAGVTVDPNRLEQEIVFWVEKLDITEEKVRLAKHCGYFRETAGEPGAGRKLGFIAQEMGREINTLGSKANDADIQKLVVQMKDELEKIKEQLLNIL